MKKIAILGSTGSIGTQTLDVVRANGDIEVLGISAGKNIQKLEEQVREFLHVWLLSGMRMRHRNLHRRFRIRIRRLSQEWMAFWSWLPCRIQKFWLLQSWECLGFARRSRRSVQERTLHLPIRKTLVTAGHLIIPMAKEYGVKILPVDSEHSAVFQSLNGEHKEEVHKLLITASGGPFAEKQEKTWSQ